MPDNNVPYTKMPYFLYKATKCLADYLNNNLPKIASNWWEERVLGCLPPSQLSDVKAKNIKTLGQMDFTMLHQIMKKNLDSFPDRTGLTRERRNILETMIVIRNRWAHLSSEEPLPPGRIIGDLQTISEFTSWLGGRKLTQENEDEIKYIIRIFASRLPKSDIDPGSKGGKKPILPQPSEFNIITIKEMKFHLYKDDSEITQDFIKKTLGLMFKKKFLPEDEIKKMKQKYYCKEMFGIEYPIIQDDVTKLVFSGHSRYYSKPIPGTRFYVCSQWWKQLEATYRPKIANWIEKIANLNNE